jgi:prevent-host-death family protein
MTMVMNKVMGAGAFKAACLALMDEVSERRTEVIITKRGKPVARLVPVEEAPRNVLGCMVGTGSIRGDVLAPIADLEDWDVAR